MPGVPARGRTRAAAGAHYARARSHARAHARARYVRLRSHSLSSLSSLCLHSCCSSCIYEESRYIHGCTATVATYMLTQRRSAVSTVYTRGSLYMLCTHVYPLYLHVYAVYVHTRVCTHAPTPVYTRVYSCVYTCLYTCSHTGVYTCAHVCTQRISLYIHEESRVCTCT